MRVLYLDCFSGISGDMTLGALIALGADAKQLINELKKLGIQDEYYFDYQKINSYGISGISADVVLNEPDISAERHENRAEQKGHSPHCNIENERDDCRAQCDEASHLHHHARPFDEHNSNECACEHNQHKISDGEHAIGHPHHHHTSFKQIRQLILTSDITQKSKDIALAVFEKIAEAEAEVHNKKIDDVCFHEVGAVDSIIDIVGSAILLDSLSIEKVIHSSVNVGGGAVKCAHGVLPVPAPATAKLLKGKKIFGKDGIGELTTPTGAGILALGDFGAIPEGKVIAEGFGFGKKDIGSPNCLRAMLIETDEAGGEKLVEFSANIDDMTGEELSFAMDKLFDVGAKDVWAAPILMKKGRPATMLSALAYQSKINDVIAAYFKYSTTLGVRYAFRERAVLNRHIEKVETPYGEVKIKISGGNLHAEYEDCKRAANNHDKNIREVADCAISIYRSER